MWNHAQHPAAPRPNPSAAGTAARGRAALLSGLFTALVTSSSTGCTSEPERSVWPGDRFRLDCVHRAAPPGDAPLTDAAADQPGPITHHLLIRRSGLVVYRIATDHLGPAATPVYGRMAAWRMKEESLRMLARQLDRANLYETLDAPLASQDPALGGDQLSIDWRRNASTGRLASASAPTTVLEDVYVVLNGFLPVDVPLPWPGATPPEVQPTPRLEKLPQPVEDLDGALEFHRRLLAEHAAELDESEVIDTLALAIAARRWTLAAELLLKLRSGADDGPATPTARPDRRWQAGRGDRGSFLDDLERLLPTEHRRRGSGPAAAAVER